MITHVWRRWAIADRSQEYEEHDRSEVLPVLRSMAGFEGARLPRRAAGGETEFLPLAEAREVLVRFDVRVAHHETAVETS